MRDDAPQLAERFGHNLFICRRRVGLSQERLAGYASLHRTEISLLERGHRLARIDTVIKLSGSLDVPPGDLLKDMGWVVSQTAPGSFVCAAGWGS